MSTVLGLNEAGIGPVCAGHEGDDRDVRDVRVGQGRLRTWYCSRDMPKSPPAPADPASPGRSEPHHDPTGTASWAKCARCATLKRDGKEGTAHAPPVLRYRGNNVNRVIPNEAAVRARGHLVRSMGTRSMPCAVAAIRRRSGVVCIGSLAFRGASTRPDHEHGESRLKGEVWRPDSTVPHQLVAVILRGTMGIFGPGTRQRAMLRLTVQFRRATDEGGKRKHVVCAGEKKHKTGT
ncbi:hypothetical protein C8R47DRAFT_1070291 [Mycena vitilis]|nr:hypothetical protein C8R47DRAFT_1070291 [Mycena vitilis]